MTKLDTIPAGAPCWMDVMSPDLATTRSFYETLLGWTSEDAGEDYGHYINFSHDGGRIAGGMDLNGPNMEGAVPAWSMYLAVDAAAATVAKVEEAGGTVVVPAMDVGGLGIMATFQDPGGAHFGIWQPLEHTGFSAVEEPGAPSWFELHTKDFKESVAFYEEVFGWDTELQGDTDDFRYSLVTTPGVLVGMMDSTMYAQEGEPNHWDIYFEVDDVAASLATAESMGGSTIMGPDETPYGVLAMAVDPTGVVYKLRTPPAEG